MNTIKIKFLLPALFGITVLILIVQGALGMRSVAQIETQADTIGRRMERALLIGSMLLVLSIELLNSAVEAVIERYGPEHHELAGRAKDMGSAAVFVLMLNVLLVWGAILGSRYL